MRKTHSWAFTYRTPLYSQEVGKHTHAYFIYDVTLIVMLMWSDGGRHKHKFTHASTREHVATAAWTCYLQAICVRPRKQLTLSRTNGIWKRRSERCMQSGEFLLLLVSDVKYTMHRYGTVPHVCINIQACSVQGNCLWIHIYPMFMYEPPADGWPPSACFIIDEYISYIGFTCIHFKMDKYSDMWLKIFSRSNRLLNNFTCKAGVMVTERWVEDEWMRYSGIRDRGRGICLIF